MPKTLANSNSVGFGFCDMGREALVDFTSDGLSENVPNGRRSDRRNLLKKNCTIQPVKELDDVDF